MLYLISSFAAFATLYVFERLYCKRRFGIFAALFWLFVFQFSVIGGGAILAENQWIDSLPHWVSIVGLLLGAFAYLTIA